ncbi:hypothetical protein M8494_02855 [Serratia ureilytica]
MTIWRQDEPLTLAALPAREGGCRRMAGRPREQQAILTALLQARSGVWVLTAARGRSKSTLAGMLVAQSPLTCWITGPSRAATEVAGEWAGARAVLGARAPWRSVGRGRQRRGPGCWWMKQRRSPRRCCSS